MLGNQPTTSSFAIDPDTQVTLPILVRVPLDVLPEHVHAFFAAAHASSQQDLNVVT